MSDKRLLAFYGLAAILSLFLPPMPAWLGSMLALCWCFYVVRRERRKREAREVTQRLLGENHTLGISQIDVILTQHKLTAIERIQVKNQLSLHNHKLTNVHRADVLIAINNLIK